MATHSDACATRMSVGAAFIPNRAAVARTRIGAARAGRTAAASQVAGLRLEKHEPASKVVETRHSSVPNKKHPPRARACTTASVPPNGCGARNPRSDRPRQPVRGMGGGGGVRGSTRPDPCGSEYRRVGWAACGSSRSERIDIRHGDHPVIHPMALGDAAADGARRTNNRRSCSLSLSLASALALAPAPEPIGGRP